MCKIKIILLILFTHGHVYAGDFWSQIETRWLAAEDALLSDYVRPNEAIRKPIGTSIVIAQVILLNRSFYQTKDCLIYKTPSKTNQGILKVINVSPKIACEKVAMIGTANLKLEGLYNIAIDYKKGVFTFIDDKIKRQIQFLNYQNKTQKKLLDTSASQTKFPGMKISYLISKNEEVLNEGDICFDVDDKCNVLIKNKCDYCPSSILPVIASNCLYKARKYCSKKLCGQKNSPACIRGRVASHYDGLYCINDSPLGFCEKNLRVFCINDELICR